MYRINALRKVVVLCTLVAYSFSKGSPKTESQIRKKVAIAKQASTSQKSDITQPRITIWLHGTKTMSVISDFVHAVPCKGLIALADLSSLYRIKKVMHTLSQSDSNRFPLEHFYAYGWSGKLCFKKRKQEAIKLYQALIDLIDQYEKVYRCIPHITLVTHSHGGNVALNLATIASKDERLTLELVLLACPVQHETKEFVKDPFFSRIYSLYSPADLMQIIDPQGLYATPSNEQIHFELSERMFPWHHTVRQAQLEINGAGVSHIGFIVERTMKMLPTLLTALDAWHMQEPSTPDKERILEIADPEYPKTMAVALSPYLAKLLQGQSHHDKQSIDS